MSPLFENVAGALRGGLSRAGEALVAISRNGATLAAADFFVEGHKACPMLRRDELVHALA